MEKISSSSGVISAVLYGIPGDIVVLSLREEASLRSQGVRGEGNED